MSEVRVVLGYDSTEKAGTYACIESILKHASQPVHFTLLAKDTLRKSGSYWKDRGEDEATEFSRTRFLVPYLMGYKGQAIFLDGADMVVQADVCELLQYAPPGTDIAVCKLDYQPTNPHKFGNTNTQNRKYRYKLWSSVVVFNCYTAPCKRLSPKVVNEQDGSWLHQFGWIPRQGLPGGDPPTEQEKEGAIAARVGTIDPAWNWVEGYSDTKLGIPLEQAKIVHYTLGGVWHPGHVKTPADKVWEQTYEELRI